LPWPGQLASLKSQKQAILKKLTLVEPGAKTRHRVFAGVTVSRVSKSGMQQVQCVQNVAKLTWQLREEEISEMYQAM
jgi:hypothetical protein